MNNESERDILRIFFEGVAASKPHDSTISDSKLVSNTQNMLKKALRGVALRCSCSKRSYGPCEVCQCSDRELYSLRNFYRQIRNAKKHNLTTIEIQEFIANTKKDLK